VPPLVGRAVAGGVCPQGGLAAQDEVQFGPGVEPDPVPPPLQGGEGGVAPGDAVLSDPHGYRTYESCKRAAEVFQIKDAIIVTQRFHIARALYLCESFGIQSLGVTSDLTSYQRNLYFWTRDLAASIKAWSDVHIRAPEPPVNVIGNKSK
jgi:vancomycin permeability regulator SanA